VKSKRPWKKHAEIMRVELNNGDVKFKTQAVLSYDDIRRGGLVETVEFEDLASAEAHLDSWWETKWKPWDRVQEKSRRRA
jgi:hypothetical protein